MACILVFAPLRVTSDSITAMQQTQARMHRVEEVQAMEPGFPTPKFRVKTACGRFLVGWPEGHDERTTVGCKGCLGEAKDITYVVVSSWTKIMGTLPAGVINEHTFLMQDWRNPG